MQKIVNLNHGLSLPNIFITLPIVGALFAYPINATLALIVFILLLIYVLSSEGVQIDLANNQYKIYTQYLWLKKGKWKSMKGYTSICVLKKRIAYSQVSRSMRTNNFTTGVTAIYLLDKTHRHKILIGHKPGYHQAIKRANELAAILNKPYEDYQPLISEKTKNRRR